MRFSSHALPEFWDRYDALPSDIQDLAQKQYAIFVNDPFHPSLRFKEVGAYCSVRVTRGYRALARRRGNDIYWFWIGRHDEYERFIKGS